MKNIIKTKLSSESLIFHISYLFLLSKQFYIYINLKNKLCYLEFILMNLKFIFIALICLAILTKSGPIKMRMSNLKTIHHHNQKTQIPEKIFAAQIHFSRIPFEYWEHRLQMVKAMGFNTLSIYIMWNHHEIEKGKFDYENGNKNLKGFLQLATKYDFNILFRPGPYVCAEWDYGGLPARLLSNKNLQIRANNKQYLDEAKIYLASLVDIMNQHSYLNGGKIIMLQIQNQYGWYGTDKSYIQAIRQIWKDLDINLPQYYVDWFQNIQKCYWVGANIGINNGIKQQEWVKVRQMEPNGYLIGGEIYSGWLTHWGQKWHGKTLEQYVKQFQFLMSNNHSFSMYMAHGGSNFALTAGANGFVDQQYDYAGHITSYDYDAPINQQGSPNQKFVAFREMAKKYATWQIPQIPQKLKTISISPFVPSGFADLLFNLPKPILQHVNELVSFEDERLKMWNQGFVVYETNLKMGKYQINMIVHDFALVYLNGNFVQAIDRGQKLAHSLHFQTSHFVNKLVILVQAMGHINFGTDMLTDKKGIVSLTANFTPSPSDKKLNEPQKQKIQLDEKFSIYNWFYEKKQSLKAEDFDWTIYTVPIDQNMLKWRVRSENSQFPRLFRYNLTLSETGDTYLNMQTWKKGYIFVNGYNLGRYWNKGPQQKLFLPGAWLKKGVNDIVVLQLLTSSAKFITGQPNLLVGDQAYTFTKHASTTINLPFGIKIG